MEHQQPSETPAGGEAQREVKVEDEFLEAKDELAKRWSTVFLGQKCPDWPLKSDVNDSIIKSIERLDQVREQYYKERLHLDCLERLCDTMKVVPVTTFMDHSVSSGYLHHLQSSMASLGIEELSLTDLDCKRRQTFSGMGDIKQTSSAFGRISQRRSRRMAPGSPGSMSSSKERSLSNSREKLSAGPTTPAVSSTSPSSVPGGKSGSGGDDRQLSVKENASEQRRLSLVNYFASKRGTSDEQKHDAAPRLKTSNMRKSFNKRHWPSGSIISTAKAASFLGRNSAKSEGNEVEASPTRAPDAVAASTRTESLGRAELNQIPHRKRSNSESASRMQAIRTVRTTGAKSVGHKSSLTSLTDNEVLPTTDRCRLSTPPTSCAPLDADVQKGSVFTSSSQNCSSYNEAGPLEVAVPSMGSYHPRTTSLSMPRLSTGSSSVSSDVAPSSPTLSTTRRTSVDSSLLLTIRKDSPTTASSDCSSIPTNAETDRNSLSEATMSAGSGSECSTGSNSRRASVSGDFQPLPELCETACSPADSPTEHVRTVSSETSCTNALPSSQSSGTGSAKQVIRSTKSDGDTLPPAAGADDAPERTMGSTAEQQEVHSDARKVQLSTRPTTPVGDSSGAMSDDKSQVLLERINTLSRRNRIMSMRRRGCSDSTVSAILTAESVNTMDFTRMAIAGYVDGERMYRNTLQTVFFNYYKPLAALASTSQPICTIQEVDTIFYCVEELYALHNAMIVSLEPIVQSEFMHLAFLPSTFKLLLPKLDIYRSYKKNFHKAIAAVGKLRADSPAFQAFLDNASQIKIKGRRVEPLEEMLRAPVIRLDNYRSLLSDLCSGDLIPPDDIRDEHSSNYNVNVLKDILEQLTEFSKKLQEDDQGNKKWKRKLEKSSICVELTEGKRKFRHIMLFTDVLMCATRARTKSKSGSNCPHDCKWFLPLEELTWHPPQDVSMEPITPISPSSSAELTQYQVKISKLKGELKHSDQPKKKFGLKHDRERKRKNLQDLEVMYKMLQHNQVVRLFSKTGKVHTLLFVEQSEKSEWTEAIDKHQKELSARTAPSSFSTVDINQMLYTAKASMQKQEEEVKAYVEDDDVELLDGLLVVLIDCAYGLKSKGKTEVFSQLEVDTYGRLERKAKTKCVPYSIKPEWDQGFEVELEAAHSLTVQIFESRMLTDNGIAKGMIDLVSSGLLDQEIHTIDVPLQPQGQLSMKLQYLTPEMMLKRSEMMKANTTTAVFSVPLEFVTLREQTLVPNIVRLCAEEVELRGLEETGIYRISGLASEVRMLREAFDTDLEQAAKLVKQVDIHAVTGALKLFLREMPEPLFPRVLYSRFVEGSNLSNIDSRSSCMVSLLYSMPDTNLLTTLYLVKHFKNVSEFSSTNKMTSSNLATVIGPNVLKPVDDGADRIVLDIGNQVNVFGFFLDLHLDLLEPEEREDVQSVQEALSTTSLTGKLPISRSSDSIGVFGPNCRDSPQGMHRGYLDIHNKSS